MSSTGHLWLDVLYWKPWISELFHDYDDFQWHALMKRDGQLVSNQQIKMSLSKWSCSVLGKLSLNTNYNLIVLYAICAVCYLRGRSRCCVYVCMFTNHLTHNQTCRGVQGTCAALLNQQSTLSGPSLLLSSDCFRMSQSLQDIRPLFTVTLSSLNSSHVFAIFLLTEQHVINYLLSRIHAGGLLLSA